MTKEEKRAALERVLDVLKHAASVSVPDGDGDEDNECIGCGGGRPNCYPGCDVQHAIGVVQAMLLEVQR